MYGCGEQEVGEASGSRWNLWVWLLGVVVRRYIDFLILLINFSHSIYTDTGNYGRPTTAKTMKVAHNVLYMKKHTQTYASYPAVDISCMISRSRV